MTTRDDDNETTERKEVSRQGETKNKDGYILFGAYDDNDCSSDGGSLPSDNSTESSSETPSEAISPLPREPTTRPPSIPLVPTALEDKKVHVCTSAMVSSAPPLVSAYDLAPILPGVIHSSDEKNDSMNPTSNRKDSWVNDSNGTLQLCVSKDDGDDDGDRLVRGIPFGAATFDAIAHAELVNEPILATEVEAADDEMEASKLKRVQRRLVCLIFSFVALVVIAAVTAVATRQEFGRGRHQSATPSPTASLTPTIADYSLSPSPTVSSRPTSDGQESPAPSLVASLRPTTNGPSILVASFQPSVAVGQEGSTPSTLSTSLRPSSVDVPEETSSIPSVLVTTLQESSTPSTVVSSSLRPTSIVIQNEKSSNPSVGVTTFPPTTLDTPWIRLIQDRSPWTTFDDSTSPQRLALDWMVQDEFSLLLEDDDVDRIIQRFALLVTYYSMAGQGTSISETNSVWVASSSECEWEFVTCNPDDVVVQLSAVVGSGGGSIPREIGLLSPELRQLHLGSELALEGTIPTEIGLLTSLKRLSIVGNNLEGTILTEIGLLTSLLELDLSRNENLQGATIPTEVGLLSALTYLGLSRVGLEGSIPTEVGALTSLKQLFLTSNEYLSGEVPTELANLASHHLQKIFLAETQLSGSIPATLCDTLGVARIECNEIECDCCTGRRNAWSQWTPC
eukprot:CAMPEP_0194034200 /NCGR_PEP_ID=MMETSP0009_2-20130614/6604_1 /TAXON_ID=210454 /ORGANISM="Grammatophora oceanica, Strain CCMP 410" /LENGTH=678 /DNA_ID=CAMNT_0038675011 /DNA_START=63 /DNA_END=2099 /DNA_ORIENTATION=+